MEDFEKLSRTPVIASLLDRPSIRFRSVIYLASAAPLDAGRKVEVDFLQQRRIPSQSRPSSLKN